MHINLLPRHRYEIDRQTWQIIIILAAIITPLMVVVFLHMLLQTQTDNLRARIASYRDEMQGYQNLLMANNHSKQSVQWQAGWQATKSLFELLVSTRQYATCLTSVVRTKNKMMIDGETRSVVDVANLAKKWANTPMIAEVSILQISQASPMRAQAFRIHVTPAENTSSILTLK